MFNRTLAREIVNEAVVVLNNHFKARNITFQRGNASFNPDSCTFKMTAIAPGANPGENTFSLYCRRFGLQPDDFGKQFSYCGKTYEIKGLNPRAPKYPIIAEEISTGKSYKFTAEDVSSRIKDPTT